MNRLKFNTGAVLPTKNLATAVTQIHPKIEKTRRIGIPYEPDRSIKVHGHVANDNAQKSDKNNSEFWLIFDRHAVQVAYGWTRFFKGVNRNRMDAERSTTGMRWGWHRIHALRLLLENQIIQFFEHKISACVSSHFSWNDSDTNLNRIEIETPEGLEHHQSNHHNFDPSVEAQYWPFFAYERMWSTGIYWAGQGHNTNSEHQCEQAHTHHHDRHESTHEFHAHENHPERRLFNLQYVAEYEEQTYEVGVHPVNKWVAHEITVNILQTIDHLTLTSKPPHPLDLHGNASDNYETDNRQESSVGVDEDKNGIITSHPNNTQESSVYCIATLVASILLRTHQTNHQHIPDNLATYESEPIIEDSNYAFRHLPYAAIAINAIKMNDQNAIHDREESGFEHFEHGPHMRETTRTPSHGSTTSHTEYTEPEFHASGVPVTFARRKTGSKPLLRITSAFVEPPAE